PLVLLLPALFSQRSLRAAATAGLVFVAASAAIAPKAWIDWLRVLPNILRFPPWEGTHNFAPVVILGEVGAAGVGTAVGVAIAVTAVVSAIVLARRERWFGAVASATVALLFGPSSLGDHYLAVLVPLIVAAWPKSGWRIRTVLVAFVGATMIPWWTPDPSLGVRVVYLVATAATCLAVTVRLARYGTWEFADADDRATRSRLGGAAETTFGARPGGHGAQEPA
ncbi:MAG TPA: hypothetical protein VGC90_10835, partial [Candidatus Limnocylindrales bacterium]